MQYEITFAATGGMTVVAENEDDAREIFETTLQNRAAREMFGNGIDITEVRECEADEPIIDSQFEELKRVLFETGSYACEDFVGYAIDPFEDKATTERRLDMAYEQMPDEELKKFYSKYFANRTSKNSDSEAAERERAQTALMFLMGALPNTPGESCRMWSDGNLILCDSDAGADAVADLIDSLYGEEVACTGYFDPEEDKRSGEVDNCTGWYYVDV